MSYAASFLLLFFTPDIVLKFVLLLGSHDKYLKGHWAETAATILDAETLKFFLRPCLPTLAAHFDKTGFSPLLFVSKWYSGLMIHVLDFENLVVFLEGFMKTGKTYCIQFGVCWGAVFEKQLLSTTAISEMLLISSFNTKETILAASELWGTMKKFDFSQVNWKETEKEIRKSLASTLSKYE